ncbi:hypothetical protein Gogos_013559 [Gossypium gossypioides]|uniref:procollagen-proline 4-dioxygenase n=1 Tax=Gossypium gossypioides TaxID=34282 RepID=A0A7J9BVY9_GOSGO|nr:hypothetical protein [Gossypium gossypioides]
MVLFCTSSRKELKDKEDIHLRHLVQSNVIDPSRVMQLSWRPRSVAPLAFANMLIFVLSLAHLNLLLKIWHYFTCNRVFQYSGFLMDEECDLLISLDTVLAMIEERISAWTFLPKENSKPLYVQHYGLEETEQNLDYFGNKSTWALSEPLMATVILYLSNVTKGGEILFPDSESKSETWSDCTKTSNIQKPVKGNAVLFFTTHLNGSPDSSSSHARCPVLEGEMWCATKFFYLRAVTGETISFDSSRNECSDEDPSCPEWAAVGECQRNPVFMVGSPDYYGTCRKSCNAC